MAPRFSFFDSPSDDVLRHVSRLKIDLCRSEEGTAISFELHGGFWPDVEPDTGTLGTSAQPDPNEFVRALLATFAAKGGAQ